MPLRVSENPTLEAVINGRKARACWDTGAGICILSSSLASKLQVRTDGDVTAQLVPLQQNNFVCKRESSTASGSVLLPGATCPAVSWTTDCSSSVSRESALPVSRRSWVAVDAIGRHDPRLCS